VDKVLRAVKLAADLAALKPTVEERTRAFTVGLAGGLELVGETEPEVIPIAEKVKSLTK
jgi:hypothetical protein